MSWSCTLKSVPLGQQLEQQAIGVLTTALLPRAVSIAEVHAHVGSRSQLLVARHLLAMVVGQRLCASDLQSGAD